MNRLVFVVILLVWFNFGAIGLLLNVKGRGISNECDLLTLSIITGINRLLTMVPDFQFKNIYWVSVHNPN